MPKDHIPDDLASPPVDEEKGLSEKEVLDEFERKYVAQVSKLGKEMAVMYFWRTHFDRFDLNFLKERAQEIDKASQTAGLSKAIANATAQKVEGAAAWSSDDLGVIVVDDYDDSESNKF